MRINKSNEGDVELVNKDGNVYYEKPIVYA